MYKVYIHKVYIKYVIVSASYHHVFERKVLKFRKRSSSTREVTDQTAARSESLNDDSARGYIIKDELVTISNRQTNWTTLGNTP